MEIDREDVELAAKKLKNYDRLAMAAGAVTGSTIFSLGYLGREGIIKRNEYIETYNKETYQNYPLREVPSYAAIGSYGLWFAFAIYTLFHCYNITGSLNPLNVGKATYISFRSMKEKLLGDSKAYLASNMELAELLEDPLKKQMALASIDFQLGNADLTFKRYDHLLNLLPNNKIPKNFVRRSIDFIADNAVGLFYKKDANHFINQALEYFKDNKINKTKLNLEKAIEVENTPETNLLYAYFLDTINQKELSINYFNKTASFMQKNEDLNLEFIGESKNKVKVIEGNKYISKGFVIKYNSDKAHLEGERDIINFLGSELRGRRRMPNHVGEIIFNGEDYESYMVREKCEILADKILNGKVNLTTMLNVAEFLADIYCAVPPSLLEEEKDDIISIKSSLSGAGVDLETILQITGNLTPVIKSFEDSPLVYRKDPHPWQWGFTDKGEVIAFDFEPAPAIRLEKDLANLTDTCPIPNEAKKTIHRRVIESYNEHNPYGKKIDLKTSLLALYNGVILRAFKAYSYLSLIREREYLRSILFDNAKGAITKIEEEYPDYYFDGLNGAHYRDLSDLLKELSETDY
ncbi:MAG: hypothetical protein Q8R00_00495 [Candidatus Nanoarchaeia archaeon]|nr:hypothetical protein [Candidatus Nanoarchaeia archaeon]